MYILKSKFEWDSKKALSNAKKHGVTFEEAITAFDDPIYLITADHKHSEVEPRQWLIGETENGKVVVVVFTKRGLQNYRIISARLANKQERRLYATLPRISF